MFRRTLPGVSILSVCLCSISLQLPTHVGGGSYFGVFGAEIVPILDPDCNAIGPKESTCKDINLICSDTPYISGPQSAAPGGVNKMRFDPPGTRISCTDSTMPQNLMKCPKQPIWTDTGKCTEVKLPTLE